MIPVPGRVVQQRQRARAHHRRERRPDQVERRVVVHVQRHLEEVHHHHRDDDLANLLLQVVDGRNLEPRELLQPAVADLTGAVGPREEELERSEAEHEADHAEEEPVQRTNRGRHQADGGVSRPRLHGVEEHLLHAHGEQQRREQERRQHAEEHEDTSGYEREPDEDVLDLFDEGELAEGLANVTRSLHHRDVGMREVIGVVRRILVVVIAVVGRPGFRVRRLHERADAHGAGAALNRHKFLSPSGGVRAGSRELRRAHRGARAADRGRAGRDPGRRRQRQNAGRGHARIGPSASRSERAQWI
mmetsp:Transcript_7008/g.31935  ORF Transcript_7008/g.31935 Transcript_7008/m.31935 type:complete len:303 (+) Transcript_7008:1577-2485(+)